ncbi:hypothetical protein ACIRPU_02050 [Streptomyces sp. NPDC102259]|uniref:hypothetical protein n=1 Tax=Streptomyces sp. NPDC102259 TaxID=3366148 RepID=UPI00381CA026
MAHSTASRTALPYNVAQHVLLAMTSNSLGSFLALIDATGDDRVAAGLTPTLLQARFLLWMEGEAERLGVPGFEILPA